MVAQFPVCRRPLTALKRGVNAVSVVVRTAVLSVNARARVIPSGVSTITRTANFASSSRLRKNPTFEAGAR